MNSRDCFGKEFCHVGQIEGEVYPEEDTTVWSKVESEDICSGYKVSRCRNCGNTAALFSIRRANGYIQYTVKCLVCGFANAIKDKEETTAIKRWNLLQHIVGSKKMKGDGGIEL